jgi:hypothetical protein
MSKYKTIEKRNKSVLKRKEHKVIVGDTHARDCIAEMTETLVQSLKAEGL